MSERKKDYYSNSRGECLAKTSVSHCIFVFQMRAAPSLFIAHFSAMQCDAMLVFYIVPHSRKVFFSIATTCSNSTRKLVSFALPTYAKRRRKTRRWFKVEIRNEISSACCSETSSLCACSSSWTSWPIIGAANFPLHLREMSELKCLSVEFGFSFHPPTTDRLKNIRYHWNCFRIRRCLDLLKLKINRRLRKKINFENFD